MLARAHVVRVSRPLCTIPPFFWKAVSLITLCREGPFWPEGRHRARAVHDPRSIEGAYHAVTARHVYALAEDLYLSSGLVRPEPGQIFRIQVRSGQVAAASAHVRLFTLARRLVATTRPHLEGCVGALPVVNKFNFDSFCSH